MAPQISWPKEPQSHVVRHFVPLWVSGKHGHSHGVELPEKLQRRVVGKTHLGG